MLLALTMGSEHYLFLMFVLFPCLRWGLVVLGGRVRARLASAVSVVCSDALGKSRVSPPVHWSNDMLYYREVAYSDRSYSLLYA